MGESSAGLYQQIVDAAPNAIVVWDDGGIVVRANGAASHLFGMTREALLGRRIHTLLPTSGELADRLGSGDDAATVSDDLVARAKAHGGRDNITALVIDIG